MAKKTLIFFFALTLFFSLSVSAATGGNGTGDHKTATKQMTASDSKSTQTADIEKAQMKMKIFMDNESAAGYELKNFMDDGSHYRADVVNSEGTLMNRIVVNKKTGQVYFAKK